jgi:hypothetical protein
MGFFMECGDKSPLWLCLKTLEREALHGLCCLTLQSKAATYRRTPRFPSPVHLFSIRPA